MKDKYGNLLCKKCKRRITSVTDKNFDALYNYHSCKIDLEICYHCLGLGDKCKCNDLRNKK